MPYATNPDDGVRTYYEVEGAGTPVLLYPGATFSHHVMRDYDYTTALGEHHQLILLDPRGTGQSDKPHETEAYTLERLVADVLAVLDDLELDQTHLVGYSRGGWVGFGLTVSAPERLLSLVAGGIHPYPRTIERGIEAMEPMVAFIESTFGPIPPNTRADLLASDVAALNAASRGVGESASLETALPAISTPCLLYCGKEDPAHNKALRAAGEIPNASFLSLHGLNHISAGGARSDFVLPHIQAFLKRVEAERI